MYFPPESKEDLARLLLEALGISEEERRVKGERGRAWASRFTWEKTAESTVPVLRRALSL